MEKVNYIEGRIDYSTDEKLWKAALLSIITFGLYYYYWFFINLRFLGKYVFKDRNHENIKWMAVLLAIPIANLLIIITVFGNIMELNKYSDKKAFFAPLFWAIFFMISFYCHKFDNYLYCLFFLTVIPILYMQNELNKYFRKE
jgi:fatty acid desaturase